MLQELPDIDHRKRHEEHVDIVADLRITCIFVDKRYRRQGLSAVALQGAPDLIAASGGVIVEGYPHDSAGEKRSALYGGTRTLFEHAGFEFIRSKAAAVTASCAAPWL